MSPVASISLQIIKAFPSTRDFVVIDTVANLNPRPMDVNIYCSNEPAAALDIEFTIDYESQKLQIDRILEDFRLLAVPLAAYIRDNPAFPWTEQGSSGAQSSPRQPATALSTSRKAVISIQYPATPGEETMIMSANLSQESLSLTSFNLWALMESKAVQAKMRTSSIATSPTSTTSINCKTTERPSWRLKRKYFGQKQQDDRAVN